MNSTTSHDTTNEFRALFGIITLRGAMKNYHLSTDELFDPKIRGSQKFCYTSLSFLSSVYISMIVTLDRKKADKFAPIR